ncbi:MAG: four helix bundle protein [Ignavibacteria bacterium]|nr:four helix bundle protein [Ignavibacteria bacterium]
MEFQYGFEKLNVWQNARKLVLKVYKLTEKFPKSENYGLKDQLRRASVSACANLAEGSSRLTDKDRAHFTTLSYSSLMEVLNHLYLSLDLNYLSAEELQEFKLDINEISNQLNSLRKSQLG